MIFGFSKVDFFIFKVDFLGGDSNLFGFRV